MNLKDIGQITGSIGLAISLMVLIPALQILFQVDEVIAVIVHILMLVAGFLLIFGAVCKIAGEFQDD